MGKTTWKGVYARKTFIRIYFVFNGNEYFESLNISPTPANMNYAESVRKEILRRIELGTFEFKEFFPDSKNAKKEEELKVEKPRFIKIAYAWLESKERELAKTTLREYRNTIDTYFLEPLGNRIMWDISYLDLNAVMSKIKVSNKTYNNVLSVLRGIYTFGCDAQACADNLAAKFKFVAKEETEPDPLELEEVAKVLQDMEEHFDERIVGYFFLAFKIGYRPSEGISLRWTNLDWNKKELKIDSAQVRGIEKDTKTGKSRIVELDDETVAWFTRMKKHTFMKGEHIFNNPITGKPFYDTSDLVQKYWRPSLKRCKIRDRDARQSRHTCATMMLMDDCRAKWAADRLGHSTEMFERVYSKWMPNTDKRQQLSKMTQLTKLDVPGLKEGQS